MKEVALCLLLVAMATFSEGTIEFPKEWLSWKSEHGKSYESELEELGKHVTWMANKKFIDIHNLYKEKFGFTLAMNHFGDLNDAEFKDQYVCVPGPDNYKSKNFTKEKIYKPKDTTLPETVDWRTKGAVSSVKMQGSCCSCYAFSAVGALEGVNSLATGMMVDLSAQNILDCSSPYGNHGCQKGEMSVAFKYVIDAGGLDKESSYPYEGVQHSCRFKPSGVTATIRGFERVKKGSEANLQNAVALQGPVSVAVDGLHNTFRFYQRGVYDQPNCSTTKVSQALLVTGYGTYEGKDFWLVKNSWGSGWGKNGYIMMARNKANQCGIATNALFPTL